MTCYLPYECRAWYPAAQGLPLSYPLGPLPPFLDVKAAWGCYPPSFLLEPGQQWDELGEWVSPPLGS